MTDHTTKLDHFRAGAAGGPALRVLDGRAATSTLLGQVLYLVAAAIGCLAVGTVLGRDLGPGAGLGWSLAGFGMLLVQRFGGQRFRVGGLAIGWLLGLSLVIGVGLGPVLAYYASVDPSAITQAVGATVLVVVAMGAVGITISKDLSGWIRPLSFAVLGLVAVSLVLAVIEGSESPLISLAIGAVSAALILVDFNYLRRHGTDDDVVLLATGIFVSIVNIFLSLLNLFSSE